MNKLITGLLVVAAFAITGPAHAFSTNSFVVDISGIAVDGAAPTVAIVNNPNGAPVIAIKFDFTYDTNAGDSGLSWGSELLVTITAPDGTQFFLGSDGEDGDDSCIAFMVDCDVNWDFDQAPGVFMASGSIEVNAPLGSGDWTVEFSDSFDDAGVDAIFTSGMISINQVPVPAAAWLLGSALMGLGAIRRRRLV